MHISHCWIALFACLVGSGCRTPQNEHPQSVYAGCASPVTRDTAGVLYVCGQLNESTVQLALDQMRPSDREIVLTSGGGIAQQAIKLAEAIRARQMTVRVRDFCLSACPTYVLLTAPRVLVEPNALVAFHHTGAFAYDVIGARTGAPASHPIFAQADRERDFFRTAGLSPDLLDRLALAVEPTCMGVRVRTNGSGKEMVLLYRWAWFVPELDTAQAMFADRLSGYWPKSGSEAQTLLERLRSASKQTVRYGELPIAIDPASLAVTLPECPRS